MMAMKELHWFEPGEKLSSDELARAQAQLGVFLPVDYSELVMKHDGGSNPDECEFEYLDRGRARKGNFGALLSLRPSSAENVLDAMQDLGDQLPAGVVPIIDTGSGDFVCFDYRAGQPCVVYFAHERAGDDAIISLAPSFAEFVDNLREPVDE